MGLSKWIFYKLFLKSEIMRNQWPSVGLSSHGLPLLHLALNRAPFGSEFSASESVNLRPPTDFDIAPCGGVPGHKLIIEGYHGC